MGSKDGNAVAGSRVARSCLLFLVLALGQTAALAAEPAATDGPVSVVRSVELANIHFQRAQYAEAMEAVVQGLQASPLYPPLWLVKAKIHYALREHDAAEEAIAVFLAAEPGDEEALLLALNIALDNPELSPERRQAALREQIAASDGDAFAKIVIKGMIARPDLILNLDLIVSAWQGAGGQRQALGVIDLYAQQKFTEAAAAITGATGLDRDIRGMLAYVVGRALGGEGRARDALDILRLAGELGFDSAEIAWNAGWLLLDLGRPAEAADAWRSAWRQADNPAQMAAAAADAMMASGDSTGALVLLDSALASFPSLPNLQARRLRALHLMDYESALRDYEARLKEKNHFPGLYYGQALIERDGGRYDLAEKALDNIRAFTTREMGVYLEPYETENWLEFGHLVKRPDTEPDMRRRMSLANRLRAAGRMADAAVMRENLLRDGVDRPRGFAVASARYLAENGMDPMPFLRRYIPEMREVDFLLAMRQGGFLQALRALALKSELADSAPNSWLPLFLALETVRLREREAAVKAVKAFAAFPEEKEPFQVHFIDVNDLVQVRRLDLADHRALTGELGEGIVMARYDELYAVMLSSAQWSARGGDDSARIDTGIALALAGQADIAGEFLENALSANPDDSRANLYLALLQERAGKRGMAAKLAEKGLTNASPEIRERLLALGARLRGDREGELLHLKNYVGTAPDDYPARLEAIQKYAAAYLPDEAEELMKYFDRRRAAGDNDVLSYLAMANLALGNYSEAESLWRFLIQRYPDSPSPVSGLGYTLNLMERPRETVDALSGRARESGEPELAALLAEAESSLGRDEEALGWIELGLQKRPDNARLLALGADTAESLERHELVERYAEKLLALQPDSGSRQAQYGRALLAQEKWDKLAKHNRQLLAWNPLNFGALEREAARVKSDEGKEAAREAARLDKFIAAHFSNDPSLLLRSAITSAGIADYRYALSNLEEMRGNGPNAAALSLYFARVSQGGSVGAVPLEEVRRLLDLMADGYVLCGLKGLCLNRVVPEAGPMRIPAALFVGRSSPAALEELDSLLAERNGRACLVIGEDSLAEKNPAWPNAAFLRGLAATGRWDFVLTDYNPVSLPGPDNASTLFWTQASWRGEFKESPADMEERVGRELDRLKARAAGAGVEIGGWLHPGWGDYGQNTLKTRDAEVQAYRRAVSARFPFAMTIAPTGYRLAGGETWRVPMRSVAAGQDAVELVNGFGRQHPTRRAVLELAKVSSWHGQHPRAERLFADAEQVSGNPADTAYFRARNALYSGDVPSALDLAALAEERGTEETRERTDKLLEDARRNLRPRLVSEPNYREDSAGEEYWEMPALFAFHVNPMLEFRVGAAYHRWKDERGSYNGASAAAGFRWYFRPRHWLQAEARGVNVTGRPRNFATASATLHGDYSFGWMRANGTYDIGYHHESLDTRRSLAAGIRANRFAFNSSTRLANWWDVDLGGYYTSRTDGNDTWNLTFRPTYRIRDLPQLRFGYWMILADSDRNPDEYYAPVDYQTHQAVVMYRQDMGEKLTLGLLGSFGRAKTASTDWRNVFRANADLTYRVNDDFSLSAGYRYLKLPDYSLRQYNLGFDYRF